MTLLERVENGEDRFTNSYWLCIVCGRGMKVQEEGEAHYGVERKPGPVEWRAELLYLLQARCCCSWGPGGKR